MAQLSDGDAGEAYHCYVFVKAELQLLDSGRIATKNWLAKIGVLYHEPIAIWDLVDNKDGALALLSDIFGLFSVHFSNRDSP